MKHSNYHDRELVILKAIRDYGKPIGSGNLIGIMEKKRIQLSQATIGRILSDLERKGYLEKKQNKGRLLTASGKMAIIEATLTNELESHKKRLDDILNTKILSYYLMILDARKAIERATVRMAAENISDEQISLLDKYLKKKESNYRQGKSIANVDISFHTLIAEASGNEVLKLVYQIISKLGQQSELFEYIREKAGGIYLTSHSEIVQALKEHNADEAEECLIRHVDILKNDVQKCWDEFYS